MLKRIYRRLARWNTWLSVPLALLGLAISLYPTVGETPVVRPSFVSKPTLPPLIESARLAGAPIRVVRHDGTSIGRDITRVTVYFWNAGKKPLMSSDVLDPFRILVSEQAEILDFKTVKASRPQITRVSVARSPGATNQLELAFRVLEEDDGIVVDLLVAGDARVVASGAAIIASGAAIGARQVADNKAISDERYWMYYTRVASILGGILFSLLLVVFVGAALQRMFARAKKSHANGDRRAAVVVLSSTDGALTHVGAFLTSHGHLLWILLTVAYLIFVVVQGANEAAEKPPIESVPSGLVLDVD